MTLDPYNTLCHHCQKVKSNCLFTPSLLKLTHPVCRKCHLARVKQYKVLGNPKRDWRTIGFLPPGRMYTTHPFKPTPRHPPTSEPGDEKR